MNEYQVAHFLWLTVSAYRNEISDREFFFSSVHILITSENENIINGGHKCLSGL